jgi:hypothetical protein
MNRHHSVRIFHARMKVCAGTLAVLGVAALPGQAAGRAAPEGVAVADAVQSADAPTVRAAGPAETIMSALEVRTLDGARNNVAHPDWGRAGTAYSRVGGANYADGKATQVGGPNPRYTSNRVFNDNGLNHIGLTGVGQNLFSERNVSQWGWTWGQFMDHTFGLAAGGGESTPIPFQSNPLESFTNDLGVISFTRDGAAPGTGTSMSNPRQHINTLSSYIDAFNVYGPNAARLEWLREGPVDGNMANNGAKLLMTPAGYLPRATARGNATTAPTMATDGQLAGHPQDRAVAGDVRANENMALTDLHTLFAREHNRIVNALSRTGLGTEAKFQIARRIVGAEEQFVTYNEFLPAMGVALPAYTGYKPNVDATLSTEFATVGYRAHSQIHGEFEIGAEADDYTAARRAQIEAKGIEILPGEDADEIEFVVPLNVAFFNPDLVELIGAGPILKGLNGEPQYKNDEQIDNSLRSVLFGMPGPGPIDPECFENPSKPGCFHGVTDLGAIDIQRGRDHGVPSYNDLRAAYGLPRKTSFKQITGEDSEAFPNDPLITAPKIDDPNILDFLRLSDRDGNPVDLGAEAGAVRGIRRTTLAARLKAVYGSVDKVEAFVGAYSEPHLAGSEMGQLNAAMWSKQFAALRDGDRFFYANDPVLSNPVVNALQRALESATSAPWRG